MSDFAFPFWIIACFAIMLLYLGNVLYFLKGWKATAQFNLDENRPHFSTRVSVVLAARDEAKNIHECLTCIVQQNYPSELFEIIIVNDASTDSTVQVVENIIQNATNLNIRILHLAEQANNVAPKKRALQWGIENAIGDLILCTDADCSMGKNWLASHVGFYQKTAAKLIVAPVKMKVDAKANLLTYFQQYDIISLVASGGASLFYNKPLLCNGANLSFEKDTYFATLKDFEGKKMASGDDMFLMLAIKNKFPKSVHFLKSKAALVETLPQNNLLSLLIQRKRWASKGLRYNDSYILSRSVLIVLSHFSLLTTGIISFLNWHFSLLFLPLFLTKFTADLIFLNRISIFFEEKINGVKTFFLVLLYPFFILLLLLMGIKKNYVWKDRKLN